jgi:beta-glucosidase
LQALSDGRLTRAELQRSAKNICQWHLDNNPLARMMNTADTVKIINRPQEEAAGVQSEDLEIIHIKDSVTIPLNSKDSTIAGTDYAFAVELENKGMYKVSITGSSELGELAQLPITIFVMGIPTLSLSFTGTNGKDVTLERDFIGQNNYAVFRLNVAQAGLKLKEMKIEYQRPFTDEEKAKMFW